MEILKTSKLLILLTVILFSVSLNARAQEGYKYIPASKELYNRIVHMDTQAKIFAISNNNVNCLKLNRSHIT
jgi:hypothetical protein